jgi:site-specific DNA-methyltransferase (adenine-specific)
MVSKVMYSSENSEWETPPELFNTLNDVFHFTLDPCATKQNAKCKKFYTKKQDGLKQSWKGESVFVNPPYGREVDKWVYKAYVTLIENKKSLIVMLLAARTETKRWQVMILPNAKVICFLKKRVKFLLNGKVRGSPAFPSAIVVFGTKNLNKKQRVALWSLGYLWEK